MTYYVCHGFYGCETGCCGYRLCLDDEGDETVAGAHFTFSHSGTDGEAVEFALDHWPALLPTGATIAWGKWKDC